MMVVTPAIIDINDSSIVLVDFNGEEKGEDNTIKDVEIDIITIEQNSSVFSRITKDKLNIFYLKKYPKPILNLVLPPPKHTVA